GLKMPVVLTNDANAAALGENLFGGAQEMKDFIVITIGTGLGSGIMVDGKILHGHSGFAGEIGHTTAEHGGRPCTCGKNGCLEAYVSARGLKQSLREILAANTTNSPLQVGQVDQLTAQGVHQLAKQGDLAARAAFAFTGKILGRHLADAVAYTSPEAIFLFGGLAKAGEFLLEPTRHHLEENLLQVFKNRIQVLPSQLLGKNAAVLGGAAFAWKVLCQETPSP
ncbi:MAG TPA: ROK family protein, partial [Bacteroidetes bacterium]|nr:ROK family protein [Bacteroidota bacterium]